MKEFFIEWWPAILATLPVIIVAAKVITKHTATTIDDEIVETVEEIVEEVKHANDHHDPGKPSAG